MPRKERPQPLPNNLPNKQRPVGPTAAMLTRPTLRPETLRRLIADRSIDVNARLMGVDQETPLHGQARHSATNTELLIKAGAELEARTTDGRTPLFTAIMWDNLASAKILVAYGADVNAQLPNGESPLVCLLGETNRSDLDTKLEFAKQLCEVGAQNSDDVKAAVTAIGEAFELGRDAMSSEQLTQTEVALRQLYELFDVTPVTSSHRTETAPLAWFAPTAPERPKQRRTSPNADERHKVAKSGLCAC